MLPCFCMRDRFAGGRYEDSTGEDIPPGPPEKIWGSPTLQNLFRYLGGQKLPQRVAQETIRDIWYWHAYEVKSALGYPPAPFGLAVKSEREKQMIFMYFSILIPGSDPDTKFIVSPAKLFQRFEDYTKSLQEHPYRAYNKELPFPDLVVDFLPSSHLSLENQTELVTRERNQTYLGVVKYDLVADLRAIMAPKKPAKWLKRKNDLLGGVEPRDLLYSPQDAGIRDMILNARNEII